LPEVHHSTPFDFGRLGFQHGHPGKLDSTDLKSKFDVLEVDDALAQDTHREFIHML